MTVKELMNILVQFHPDLEVVIDIDGPKAAPYLLDEDSIVVAAFMSDNYDSYATEENWNHGKGWGHADIDEDADYPGDNVLVIGP
jgi:hypothetical protein